MNNGGPAFPHDALHQNAGGFAFPESGMTLRDYFAGQALPKAIDQAKEIDRRRRAQLEEGKTVADGAAYLAYEIADAMIRECEREAESK